MCHRKFIDNKFIFMLVFYPFSLAGLMLFFGLGAIWSLGFQEATPATELKCLSVNVLIFLLFMFSFMASLAFRNDLDRTARLGKLSGKFPLISGAFSFFIFCIILGSCLHFSA